MGLWVFGYDMDNMKARCWYESTLPLYGLAECDATGRQRIQAEVGLWLDGAQSVAAMLRGSVKDAWFSADSSGDFSSITAAFWSQTADPFYAQLRDLIDAVRDGGGIDELAPREHWHRVLLRTAMKLFDEVIVGAGPIERGHPRRVALAWRQLKRSLNGPKLRQALGLPDHTSSPTRSVKGSRSNATPSTPQEEQL